MAEFFFHGADDLAAILEGLGVGDFDFEDEFGQGHEVQIVEDSL